MSNEILTPLGTLYISNEVLMHDKWIVDQAISAAMSVVKKYKYLDAMLKPSKVRKGDFSLILADLKMSPTVAAFIGIPGRAKAPIIQELFVSS